MNVTREESQAKHCATITSVKTNCVSCAKRIPDPETNYFVRGNYCPQCSILADLNYKNRRKALRLQSDPTSVAEKLAVRREKKKEKKQKIADENTSVLCSV